MDAGTADIANARITLYSQGWPRAAGRGGKNCATVHDPGLLFDWSHALRLAGQDSEAHAVLLRASASPLARDHAARWWAEVNVQARDALAAADPRTALALVQHAGFSSGDQYADQQFLAGFLQLRFLKDADCGAGELPAAGGGRVAPISKSRAYYWEGRAYEALGENARALARYRLAAGYPETFLRPDRPGPPDAAPVLHLSDTIVEADPAAERWRPIP